MSASKWDWEVVGEPWNAPVPEAREFLTLPEPQLPPRTLELRFDRAFFAYMAHGARADAHAAARLRRSRTGADSQAASGALSGVNR